MPNMGLISEECVRYFQYNHVLYDFTNVKTYIKKISLKAEFKFP